MNNQNTYPINQSKHDSDEIDLGELVLRVWAARGRVIASLFIVFALYASYVIVSYLGSHKTVRYSNVYDLNFEGLSKGEFPNGSAFQMSDITSNAVLNRVYEQNNLQKYDLQLDEFRRAVSITPYAPNAEFIRAKYRERLAAKGLSAADAANLETEMARELDAARSSSILISLTLPEQQALPNNIAEKVLLDISSVWADRAINEIGVLKPAISVYSDRIFNNVRFENLDYLLGINLVLESIDLVRKNIADLQKQPNANTLVDDVSGFTLADLDKAIRDIAEYDIRQIIDPIDELGITRNEDVVRLHYTRMLSELERDKAMWLERSESIRTVLKSYSENARGENEVSGSGAQNNMVPQLGDAFLDRLLEVSRQGSDLEFRQKLTLEMLELENKAIDVEQRIQTIRRTLTTLNNEKERTGEFRTAYIKTVEEQLPVVLEQLREYTRTMNRIYEKQGRQVAGNMSELISPAGGTYQVASTRIVTMKDIKILAVLLVLTGFVSIFLSLLLDVLRQTNKELEE